MSSETFRPIFLMGVLGAAMLISACATAPARTPSPGKAPAPTATRPQAPSPPSEAQPSLEPPVESTPPPAAPEAPRAQPRTVASMELAEQGRLLLERGQPDQAIRTLERALNLNPGNGRACYYLAEAWLSKGNPRQARSFNRLAEIHLRRDEEWKARVLFQRGRIEGK